MNLRSSFLVIALAFAIAAVGCKPKTTSNTSAASQTANPAAVSKNAGPLPDRGFRAQITLPEEPLKLRVGQKETITVKVKNTSDVIWWQRGGEINDRADNSFYIALGNHWLDKDGKRTLNPEGHNGIPRDMRPGEETEMTLLITAPQEPGEYVIELDMVQEAVAWFGEKGSPTTKAKVTVVR